MVVTWLGVERFEEDEDDEEETESPTTFLVGICLGWESSILGLVE